MDADTDLGLFEVVDGMVLNLDVLPPNLNLQADTVPAQVGSVAYEYDAKDLGRTENITPYSLGGDDGNGDFQPFALEEGEHVVTATAYDGQNGSGVRGGSVTVRFTVARLGQPPPQPDAGAGEGDAGGEKGLGGLTIGDDSSGALVTGEADAAAPETTYRGASS